MNGKGTSSVVLRSGRIVGNEYVSPSTSRKHVTFQVDSVIPAKRVRRVLSVPASKVNANVESTKENSKIAPAKRKARCNSTSSQQAILNPETDDAISKLVTMNCKLTNEILLAKKQLCEKSDTILKLQERLHQNEIKGIEMTATIKSLEDRIEKMHSDNFCDDLIDLKTDAIQDSGEIVENVDLIGLVQDGNCETRTVSSSNVMEGADAINKRKEIIEIGCKNANCNNANGAEIETSGNQADAGFRWTPTD